MPDLTFPRPVLKAFAGSHPGLHRENNEDRVHADAERGIFFVVDGVGGQAAGDKAAETALALLRARLERETGSPVERIREAITLANNEILRLAQAEPRWSGMACVMTVAVVHGGTVTIGHVGDTRLYLVQGGEIRKITRDHSPVGEREDRGDLTETEAMRHPRRNEIYRDVGSEPHSPGDEGFIEAIDFPFEPDAALLLCTDGLTDLVPAAAIRDIVLRYAGNPPLIVNRLLQAANDAGGKDNVSAVFVEGARFAAATKGRDGGDDVTSVDAGRGTRERMAGAMRSVVQSRWLALVLGCALGFAAVVGALTWTTSAPLYLRSLLPAAAWPRTWVVTQDGTGDCTTIGEALGRAKGGDVVRVEPGEYAEAIVLTGSVTLVSSVRRGAVIVAPPDATERTTAVEMQPGGARLVGFRIVGDARRPLAVGLRLRRSGGEVDDVEVSGTRVAAIDIEGPSQPTVRSSYVHDNIGTGVLVEQGAAPSLLHNVIANNGRQPEAIKPGLDIHEASKPVLFGNIIANNGVDAIRGRAMLARDEFSRDNIIGLSSPPPANNPAPATKKPPR
jgi:serine/threonine protein phosphatase PrpC